MARDVEAGKAFIRVSVKENMAGLKNISKRLKSWGAGIGMVGGAMTAAGAAVMGPLVAMTNQFAAAGDVIDKTSTRMGVSAEFASALAHAASLGGTSLEDMEKAFKRMQKTAFDASQGMKTAQDAFRELGISAKGQNGQLKDSEQLFMEATAALAEMDDHTKKAALAQELFGRAGTMLLPMLTSGADGIANVIKEAERLGIVMTTEDSKSAAALSDAMGTLKTAVKAVSLNIGAALAPALTDMSARVTEIVAKVIAFVKVNRPLVMTVAKIALGVMGVGTAIAGLGAVFAGAGFAISGLVTVLGAIGAVLGVVLSPIGLLVAGVAAGTAALLTFTETGQWLASTLMADFGTAFDTVKATIGGITDALKAGEFKLAGEIAMTGLKLAFFEATKSIRTIWIEFNKALVGALISAGKKIVDAFSNIRKNITYLMAGMKTGLAEQDMNAALAELESRKGSMSEREYKVAKRDIYQGGADAMLQATTEADSKLQNIDGDMQRWKSSMDEFGNVVDENLNASLTDGEARIAALRAELSKLTGTAAERVAALPKTTAPPKPHEVAKAASLAGATLSGMTGTFSAAAAKIAFAGAGDDIAKQTAENTKQSARSLRKIEQQYLALGGFV